MPKIRQVFRCVCLTDNLCGDVVTQGESRKDMLLDIQCEYVPHHDEVIKPIGQPWFGPRRRSKKMLWKKQT